MVTTRATAPSVAAPGIDSVAIVSDTSAAGALLSATRRAVLGQLREPGSATSAAAALGLSRQKVNYHVRALERAGLIVHVGYRQRRGLKERVVRATATRYLIAPDAHDADASATRHRDRSSAAYQVAIAARTIREVGALADGARKTGKRLSTLTVDTELTFASPGDRQAFADELVEFVTGLVARYHRPDAPDGRRYRLFTGAHPTWMPPSGSSS